MAKFQIQETIHSEKVHTVRLGDLNDLYGYEENGKAMKLVGESRYALAETGDTFEAFQQSSNYPEQGTMDGYSIGGIVKTGYKEVTFDGLEATPGTGVVAIGDYVVVGTVVAKGVKLPGPLRVVAATDQAAAASGFRKARVESLGKVGTGAAGTVGVVEMF